MPKLSIVVPVYNVERFIRTSLDSIAGQIFKDFEVILIDDGSTDGSGHICKQYARSDNRFRYIYQKNKGVSSARNKGIEESDGEFLAFVDPDDWINPDYYQRLMEEQKKYNADVVESRVEQNNEDGGKLITSKIMSSMFESPDYIIIAKGKDEIASSMIETGVLDFFCWNKVYSRKLWENWRFTEDISIGEDMAVVGSVVIGSRCAVYTPEPLYHYRWRKESLSSGKLSKERIVEGLRASKLMQQRLVVCAPEYQDQIDNMKVLFDFSAIHNQMRYRENKSLFYVLAEIAPDICEHSDNQLIKEVFGFMRRFAPKNG